MNQMSELSPTPKKVLVLNAIKPTPESARSERLEYAGLSKAAANYSTDDKLRQEVFWNSPDDSLEERQAAQQLAMQYMLMGAARLNNEAVRPESKRLWSERYTDATSEIYGSPEAVVSKSLLAQQVSELVTSGVQKGIDNELLDHFLEAAQSYGLEAGEADKLEKPFSKEAKGIGEVLISRYGEVFDALELDTAPRQIDMNNFMTRVERALVVLADQHDLSWSEWHTVPVEDKDQLSVESGKKVINIGMKRADVTPMQAKALFGHEVLDHGLRAVNGAKLSKELGSGLSGYLDAEEGLGIFFEYAITGEIPDKAVDRYVDIALALGKIDGTEHTRAELLDFAMTRAFIRNELADSDLRQTDEEIRKEVYAHVNRIYRGSLGNEYTGVFTKDISYYAGFQQMGQYISLEIEKGKSYEEIFDYLMTGKFDPTNQQHVAYLDTARNI
jgi:hypothetical protein